MFAGHMGAALVFGRAERRMNVGVFVAAAFLLDVVLWVLVLIGAESVDIPPEFASTHQPRFEFPYSHGLVASLCWSVLTGAGAWLVYSRLAGARWRAATLIAAAVYSHWLLDVLVHRPELPVLGEGSSKIGLGLWQTMLVALGVETAIVVAGVFLFVADGKRPRGRLLALVTLTLAVLAFTIAGMTIAPPPPSASVMATSSLATLGAVILLACWLDRSPRPCTS